MVSTLCAAGNAGHQTTEGMSTDFELKARTFVFQYRPGTDNFEGQFELDYVGEEKLRQVLRIHAPHALAGTHRLDQVQLEALKHFVVGDEDPVIDVQAFDYVLQVFVRVGRSYLLKRKEFWALHFNALCGISRSEYNEDLTFSALGVEPARAEEFFTEELASEDYWPHFNFMLPGGYCVTVEYNNFPEDHQIEYQLRHAGWPDPVVVGVGTGNFFIPPFRWSEVLLFSRLAALHSGDTLSMPRALLLLSPGVWPAQCDDPRQIRAEIGRALEQLGLVKPEYLDPLVEQLARGGGEIRWRKDARLGWINDGEYSFRNPHQKALTADDYGKIESMLAELGRF